MFVKFNYNNFPNVHVTFGKLNSTEEFNILTTEWLRLYEQKIPFTFIFDTTNLEVYNIKYSFKMSAFIYRLKKEPEQYLQRSIILVKNSFIQHLLDLIFFIQSPVAPVYIVRENDDIHKILDGEEVDRCKIIYP
tara:strand:+ start:62 stop:463 length:402 start_codon:yes stop_codon:yes gene_type:complete